MTLQLLVFLRRKLKGIVIPAKAGIQALNMFFKCFFETWIPAFAGMTPWAVSIFLGILLGVADMTPLLAAEKNRPVISRITFRITDIFDFENNPSLQKFPYSTINLLHIRTQESVIKNEVLQKVGDQLDPFLISETERNLRALSFVRAARIAKFPQRDGTVALVVHVNDSWTTEPQLNLGGQNKIDSREIGFKEKNLFGMGKNVGVFYKETPSSTQREYSFTDPRLLGSRWQLKGSFISETNGSQKNASIERPFFSADTKWTAGARTNLTDSIIDEYEKNNLVSRFGQTKETNELSAGTKLGGGRNIVNRAGLRWRKTNTNYERIDKTPPDKAIPENSQLQSFFLDLSVQHNDFFETTHLEKMTRVEDVNKGPIFSFSPGFSPRKLGGAQNQSEAQLDYEQTLTSKNKAHIFVQSYQHSGRKTLEANENQLNSIKWKYYHRLSEMQTWVLHTRLNWGNKLDPDNQIKMGGDNGLRAFKTDAIVGNKSWLFNAENRLYLIDEIFSLVSVGGVVFYDTGYVWAKESPVSLSKLRSDIGMGLRFGLTRSSNEVIVRFDLSYRLQVDNPNDSHLVVTFGTGQAF